MLTLWRTECWMCWYRRVELFVERWRRRGQVLVYSGVLGAASACRSTLYRPPAVRRRLLGTRSRQRTLPVAAAFHRRRRPRGRRRGTAGAPQDRRRAGAKPRAGRRLGLQPVAVPDLRRPPRPVHRAVRWPPTSRVLSAGDRLHGRPLEAVVPRRRTVQLAQRPDQLREGFRHGPLFSTDYPLVPVLDWDSLASDLNPSACFSLVCFSCHVRPDDRVVHCTESIYLEATATAVH